MLWIAMTISWAIFSLGLTQKQLLTENRIAIITQDLVSRYSRGFNHLQAL
jgi:hypothetical protein